MSKRFHIEIPNEWFDVPDGGEWVRRMHLAIAVRFGIAGTQTIHVLDRNTTAIRGEHANDDVAAQTSVSALLMALPRT